MRSVLSVDETRGRVKEIVDSLYTNIPSGLGSHRKDLKLSRDELKKVLKKGAGWAVEKGYGSQEDLTFIEDGGRLDYADPDTVSDRAYERGKDQLGTLGSGNHFVEVGYRQGGVRHPGSRGLRFVRGPSHGHDPHRLTGSRVPDM